MRIRLAVGQSGESVHGQVGDRFRKDRLALDRLIVEALGRHSNRRTPVETAIVTAGNKDAVISLKGEGGELYVGRIGAARVDQRRLWTKKRGRHEADEHAALVIEANHRITR